MATMLGWDESVPRAAVPLVDWMQPRDHSAAARTVSTLCAVAVVVTVVFAPIAPQATPGIVPLLLAVSTVLAVAAMSLLARVFVEANRLAWAVSPLLAVAALVVIDLATSDASVSAQIFFLFPVLYGASLLPRAGAVVMTVAALVGEAVVVASQMPVREGLTDIGYVSAALVTAAILLGRSSQRQATLVAELQRMAAVDPLTGLVTRRVLDEAAAFDLCGAGSNRGTSLILIDVDEFKSVNDRFGHPGGDQVLVELAGLVRRGCRSGDVACRIGGDEIALLLPGCSSQDAHRRAEQILLDVRAHDFTSPDHESGHDPVSVSVSVSVSVGVAHAPTDAADLQALYRAADAALYAAKRSGRDRVVASTPAGRP